MASFSLKQLAKKLRFIDYLIIVILIILGIISFQFFFPEEKWIRATVYAPNTTIFLATSLQKNDVELNSSGKTIAQIESIQTYDTSSETDRKTSNKNIFIDVKLLVTPNKKTNEYEFKNKIIKVGSPIELLFLTGVVRGNTIAIEGIKQERKTESKKITLKLYEQWPWLADNLTIGQIRKDGMGENEIEILSKEVVPAVILVNDANGNAFSRTDPRKVDITLTIKIQLQKFGEDFIYGKDRPIIVGEPFSFDIGNTRLEDALITNIE